MPDDVALGGSGRQGVRDNRVPSPTVTPTPQRPPMSVVVNVREPSSDVGNADDEEAT